MSAVGTYVKCVDLVLMVALTLAARKLMMAVSSAHRIILCGLNGYRSVFLNELTLVEDTTHLPSSASGRKFVSNYSDRRWFSRGCFI